MNLTVAIDELILYGFAPGDRGEIGVAVARELTRLLGEGEMPSHWRHGGEQLRLDGGAFSIGADARPAQVGAQIGQAIYRELTQ